MAYKITDTAIIIESNGETILIADQLQYEESITFLRDSDFSLPVGYVDNYFSAISNGYSSGGGEHPTQVNRIEKYPVVSNGNATDIADLTQVRRDASGQSSGSHGYTSGGRTTPQSPDLQLNTIDKFPFSTDTNAADVGDITVARYNSAGQSSSTHGYTSAGYTAPPFPAARSDVIDKFPFSSDDNATDVGDLIIAKSNSAGQNSPTHGYISGGRQQSPYAPAAPIDGMQGIEKFPFSSDANSTSVGDLGPLGGLSGGVGFSGPSDGFHVGYDNNPGFPYPIRQDLDGIPSLEFVQKFPFSTDANSIGVGNLSVERTDGSGTSTSAFGHYAGGIETDNVDTRNDPRNEIDKFAFSSFGNSVDVGDLTAAIDGNVGQQG